MMGKMVPCTLGLEEIYWIKANIEVRVDKWQEEVMTMYFVLCISSPCKKSNYLHELYF